MLQALFARKLTPERFAQAFAKQLEQLPGINSVRYDKDGFWLKQG